MHEDTPEPDRMLAIKQFTMLLHEKPLRVSSLALHVFPLRDWMEKKKRYVQ